MNLLQLHSIALNPQAFQCAVFLKASMPSKGLLSLDGRWTV